MTTPAQWKLYQHKMKSTLHALQHDFILLLQTAIEQGYERINKLKHWVCTNFQKLIKQPLVYNNWTFFIIVSDSIFRK